jgi:outer membrane lipoprotein-sorting protein
MATASAAAVARDPVARLERGLRTTRDLQARLTQIRRSPLVAGVERARGRLYLRRPGDARLEYEAPEPLVMLRRGDTAYVYVKSLAQVQVMPATGAGVPVGWVLGSRIEDIRKLATVRAAGDEVVIAPREGSGLPWTSVRLGFPPVGDFPVRFVLEDGSGEVVEIRLEALLRNRGIPEERFRARWPAGTRRVDLGS